MPSPNRNFLTASYYVYCVTFYSQDIPDSFRRHALAGFPRSAREMWVWKRSSRNLLLAVDPKARADKHVARKCSRCGRWCVGLQAQMMEGREIYARMNNQPVAPCCSDCKTGSRTLLATLRSRPSGPLARRENLARLRGEPHLDAQVAGVVQNQAGERIAFAGGSRGFASP